MQNFCKTHPKKLLNACLQKIIFYFLKNIFYVLKNILFFHVFKINLLCPFLINSHQAYQLKNKLCHQKYFAYTRYIYSKTISDVAKNFCLQHFFFHMSSKNEPSGLGRLSDILYLTERPVKISTTNTF